jgi:pyridoxal phosphate enzyme (YggS family)
MNDLSANLEKINARIAAACRAAGRDPAEVALLAVSKAQPAAAVRRLHAAGQLSFGENYVREALAKQSQLQDLDIEWHFIGPIQSNKTSGIAAAFHWVQSVDRAKVLQRLSAQRPGSLPALNVCLQVNIDREQQKAGALPEEVPGLAQLALGLPRLRLRGLMAIPRLADEASGMLPSFIAMQRLFGRLRAAGMDLDTLSIGMSGDFEQAIRAGSTMVRIGTGLFGGRG